MQRAHQLARSIIERSEVVDTEERHRCRQANLPRAVHVGVLFIFLGRGFISQENNCDQQDDRKNHTKPSISQWRSKLRRHTSLESL
jgi:hypothetical protein